MSIGKGVAQTAMSGGGVNDRLTLAPIGHACGENNSLLIRTEVTVSIQYEDRSLAIYDREDNQWFGGDIASAELPMTIGVELFIEVDLATRRFITAELRRSEYVVSEPNGRYR